MDMIDIGRIGSDTDRYLARVRLGERFLITDHGVPVAELGPVSPAMQGLMELVAAGTVTWSGGKPIGARIANDGPTVSDAVIQDRGARL